MERLSGMIMAKHKSHLQSSPEVSRRVHKKKVGPKGRIGAAGVGNFRSRPRRRPKVQGGDCFVLSRCVFREGAHS